MTKIKYTIVRIDTERERYIYILVDNIGISIIIRHLSSLLCSSPCLKYGQRCWKGRLGEWRLEMKGDLGILRERGGKGGIL